MPTVFNLLRLGAATALTRDCLCGLYTEIQVYDGRWPPAA